MSSDYYGSIAGEQADAGSAAGQAFLEWLDTYTCRTPAVEAAADLHSAFMAGVEFGRLET